MRVRFAPSPTGYLHVGGARTALFNWLLARQAGGQFILRIEDTDVARSTEESMEAILVGMRWLGLTWDEGPDVGGPHAPYVQSERGALYREHAERLIASGHAYPCFCTKEELDALREQAAARNEIFRYPGTYRDFDPAEARRRREAGEPHVIRFKTPGEGVTVVEDLVHGTVTFQNAGLDDFVLLKNDGGPTYNFACVVDDALMEITHVLRGDDHLSNTPKQMMIYEALGYALPRFGHIPMILGQDRSRLSKRHGATSVMAYDEDGYLAHGLRNYLARLGWAHGDDEVFSMEDLIAKFSVEGINDTAAVFDPTKLKWLNGVWMRQTPADEMVDWCRQRWAERGWLGARHTADWQVGVVKLLQERTQTLLELVEASAFCFETPELVTLPESATKFLTAAAAPALESLRERLAALEEWTPEAIEAVFRGLAAEREVKLAAIIQPARVALTGSHVSPGMFETAYLIGRELVVTRLEAAIARIASPV